MVTVRRIRDDEGPVLRDLRLRALADAPEAFGQGLEDARAQPDAGWTQAARQASGGDSRIWLIAEEGAGGKGSDGEGLGDADSVAPADGDTATGDADAPDLVGLVQGRRRPPDTLLIFSMWVDPAARRRGIGRVLVDEVTRWGRLWGARRAVLWVFAVNEPAIRFYEKLDFRAEMEGEDAASGHAYGAVAMSRPIEAGG